MYKLSRGGTSSSGGSGMLLRKVMVTIPSLAKALKDLFQRRVGPLLLVQRHLYDLQRQRREGWVTRVTRLCYPAMHRMTVFSVVGRRDRMWLLIVLAAVLGMVVVMVVLVMVRGIEG